ncbi:hypothetical protein [Rhizobium indicum]|uniref:Uncharacterized protein n=1 Tax=Rhizobium indicum TaxID=2583231 RepID=A0ABX6PQK9_9HYPH|nr:hypothetical protein [Rhizobium indicum]QKK20969.1 hypothetical protein FFM53_031590 [Rhizobium indicum]
MTYFVEVTVGKCSVFSIYDLAGGFCEDSEGKKIKDLELPSGKTFDIDVDEGEKGDPGQIKVTGTLDGDTDETVRLYEIRKSDGEITFPNEGVVYSTHGSDSSHKTTVEMIRENPKFDDFVSAVGNRFNTLGSQEKYPREEDNSGHQDGK